MKLIPLHNGMFAKVDDEDYAALSVHRWLYLRSKGNDEHKSRNYAAMKVGSVPLRMHVFLLGKRKGFVIDHKNGDGLDNQRSNLRWATNSQNGANRGPNTRGSSKYKGVRWDKSRGKWMARIMIDRKDIHLGRFDSERDAAFAYDAAAIAAWGAFAYRNFPFPSRVTA